MKSTEQQQARMLFDEWFIENPDIKNPSEINSEEKALFLLRKGWNSIKVMQTARKKGFEWTKRPKDRKDQTCELKFV